jgi:MerR family mercuric resistance operon transcriptional regulator
MALSIGQLARRADVNVETVRYYERRGLLPEPPRTAAGYRQYDPDTIARLHFIKRAQDLGFTLNEVEELLSLRVDPGTSCEEVRTTASRKRREIDRKIRDLRRMKSSLEDLIAACDTRRSTSACPILEALDT